MVKRLILVLGDQLTDRVAALREGDPERDVVVMAEVDAEAGYVGHHPKKIAFLFAAMRHFAQRLEKDGWTVDYQKLDAPDAAPSLPAVLLAAAERHGTTEVLVTRPGEWRLIAALEDTPLSLSFLEDDRFVASHAEFENWADGRKERRMEWFYRDMRRKTGLLMDGDNPVGGKWNFDHDNRKPAPDEVDFSGPMQFTPDAITEEVLDLVEMRFASNFGALRPFWFAVEPGQAKQALAHWITHGLPKFGDFQDAMITDQKFLWHSVISIYLNAGLLDPIEVCEAAEAAYQAGDAPINAVEGFIRQVIGWREYVRGIYFLEGADYARRNALNHQRKLPEFFWTAETDMLCVAQAVEQTRDEAYAHHIQRLMVTGNFALLAGINPWEVHEWYLAVYADAYEWVEAPNVIGMSQFADGGIVASKPYISSGNYINKMSDYCKKCSYSVSTKTGQGACPFNLLYWNFLDRHRETFDKNPRMGQMYRVWDRMDADKRATILSEADDWLDVMSSGKRV